MEAIQNKVDNIGGSLVHIAEVKSRAINNMLRDEEILQATKDYIFGVSEENPLQAISDDYNSRVAEYEEKVDALIVSYKIKARIKKLK